MNKLLLWAVWFSVYLVLFSEGGFDEILYLFLFLHDQSIKKTYFLISIFSKLKLCTLHRSDNIKTNDILSFKNVSKRKHKQCLSEILN